MKIEEIFADVPVAWGKKYPPETKLVEIWKTDPEYLLWASNLTKNKAARTLPPQQFHLVHIAHAMQQGQNSEAKKLLDTYQHWEKLSLRGENLDKLPRPTAKKCQALLESCTLLCGHSDLDGIYSLAIAITKGGALSQSGAVNKIPFSKLRLFNYNFNSLDDYTNGIKATKDDSVVIIDFAAHPQASLNLDHHSTCLSFWQIGTELPVGIFDISMPSCPRLLAVHCGLKVDEELLAGSDMIDGAQYKNVAQASDLTNPFVALELSLSVDVSEIVAKKAIITLAENKLDPNSVLSSPSWAARTKLIAEELKEQRSYWSKANRFDNSRELVATADARNAPYPAGRFRYLPFENQQVIEKPYLITIRNSYRDNVNLGTSRNPFYKNKKFFDSHSVDLGVLSRSLGQGGGRKEAASLTIPASQLSKTIEVINQHLESAV